MELTFTTADVAAFRALSGDANPLHVGTKPVVHGVLAALAVLRELAAREPVRVRRAELQFLRPIATDTRLAVAAHGDRYELADRLALSLALSPARAFTPQPGTQPVPLRTQPDQVSARDALDRVVTGHYALSPRYRDAGCRALGLALEQLAPIAVTALAWASYFVGMELPGRRALLCALDLEVADDAPDDETELDYEARVDRVTDRVHLSASLTAHGRAFATARIESLAG